MGAAASGKYPQYITMVVFIFTPLGVVTCEPAAPVARVSAPVRTLALEANVSNPEPKTKTKTKPKPMAKATSGRKRKRVDDNGGGKYRTRAIRGSDTGPHAKRARVCTRARAHAQVFRHIDQAEVSEHDLLFCDEGALSASQGSTLGSEDYINKLLYCDEGPLSASGSGGGPERASTSVEVSLRGGSGGSAVSSLRRSLEMAEADVIISDLCRWDQRSGPDLGHWGNGLLDDLMALWHP
jgi:hypothetical protein